MICLRHQVDTVFVLFSANPYLDMSLLQLEPNESLRYLCITLSAILTPPRLLWQGFSDILVSKLASHVEGRPTAAFIAANPA